MVFGALTYLDLILAVLLIISAIVGAVKGFAKQFFSFISFFAIILVSVLLCELVGNLLYPVFGKGLEGVFESWVKSKDVDGLFTTAQNWTDSNNVSKALTTLGVPSILTGILGGVINSTFVSFGESAILLDVFPPVLAKWTTNAISFVLIAILMAIIVHFIKRAVFKLVKKPVIGGINRLLGCVVSLFYRYCLLSVALTLITALSSSVELLSSVHSFLTWQAQLSKEGFFPIFHFMQNYNFIGQFVVDTFFKLAL